ncbi:acyl carrier protein [Nocardia sp. NPDC051911]|uniref:acyl carrier protein n=1 Tax=Nocardia sp. NPDC051911 TaxID=3154648 RepID=UPI0034209753
MWDDYFDAIVRRSLVHLDPDAPLDPDARLTALGLGSLQTVALLVSLEDHYGVTFDGDDLTAATFRTPASLWSALSRAKANS